VADLFSLGGNCLAFFSNENYDNTECSESDPCPDDPDFRKKRKENAAKGNYDVEFLADWDLQK
jgi:hypothetical protein